MEPEAPGLCHDRFPVQALVPGMRRLGGGAIINLGSVSSRLGLPDLVLYEIARAGIEGSRARSPAIRVKTTFASRA